MKVRSVHFWIAALSLVAVVGVAIVDLDRTSPGEVTSVHARDEKIDGGQSCSACHGGFFSSMTDSCLECHAPIATQIEALEGLHGTLENGDPMACASCHSEHHGSSFAIVNRQSFALAGVKDPKQFDHARIGWEMGGAHLELDCAECHVNAYVDVLPAGETRYVRLDQDCASCHEDPHQGAMSVSCASCHGQATWEEMHAEGHERHLPLIGGHGDLDCRACHAKDTDRALEEMSKFLVRPDDRTCAECHASPHAAEFTRGTALLAAMPPEQGCVVCHAAEHVDFRDERLELSSAQHAASGFPLELPHERLTCADCHDPLSTEFAERYPGRDADRCSQCHADPHGGQFQEGPFSVGDCLACHDRTRFEPHAFDLEKHARADFGLTGTHETTECNACHMDAAVPGGPRVFRGLAGKCEDCHADVHGGIFEESAAVLPALAAGECARCHDTTRFAAVPAERFDHGIWTGFDVDGAHAQESCESCHVPRHAADFDGRRFGKVAEHFGTFIGCVTCHQDPHEGRFDGPQFPVMVAEREDCARCHDTTSFRAMPQGFDHGRWAGFELLGGHASTQCSDCHTPRVPPDARGRTWEPALGTGCDDCHDNPHGAQFELEGRTDCTLCHDEGARNFSTFDHDRDSRFPLGDTHRDVACAKCHASEVPARLKNALPMVRYKPLATECASCHGVHEEVLLRRKAVNK